MYNSKFALALSTDSGKGTSTAGSSRPSSQVIDDGVRPVRSWSIGKCNILSPLTDQVAPAPSSEPEDNRRHKTSCSTDGNHTQHSCITYVYITPSIALYISHHMYLR